MKKTTKQAVIDLAHGLTMNHTAVEEGHESMKYVKECLPRFLADVDKYTDANQGMSCGKFLAMAGDAIKGALECRTKAGFLNYLSAAIMSLETASKRVVLSGRVGVIKLADPKREELLDAVADADTEEGKSWAVNEVLRHDNEQAALQAKPFAEMTTLEKNIHNERFILAGHKAALEVLKEHRPAINYISQLVMMKAIEASERWLKTLEAKQAEGDTDL